ncbi:MAG: efflux RND transporter periplasmic adaptor subunit [Pseudomonadota bacterium]
MMSRPLFLALVLAALSACGDTSAPEAHASAPEEALLVQTAPASSLETANTLTVTGTVRARSETVLSFTAPGRVETINFDEGAKVPAGTVLARLDPSQVGAATAAAAAEVRRAEEEYNRQKFLFDRGWVTAPRIESAQANLDTARAQLRSASFDSSRANIVAPVAGTVLVRHVERNQIINPGEPVITLAESARGFVMRVPVSDRHLDRLRIGASAEVEISAIEPHTMSGQIIEIGARSDDATGTFVVEIALPARSDLRSGLVGDATITMSRKATDDGVISVPSLALFDARAGEAFVYVESEGVALAKLVMVSGVDGDATLISSGISPGDRVITSDIERLRPGMSVRLED